MKLNIRLLLTAAILAVSFCDPALCLQVTTGSQNNEGIVDNSDIFLYGTVETGCLVQIIKITSGSVPHQPDKNGIPTAGDVIIGVSSIGATFAFEGGGSAIGRFASDVTANTGDNIYVRAWNSAEVSGATQWGTSEVHTCSGLVGETWNINGSTNINAFKTMFDFDNVPPGPPSNFRATPEANGNIILIWTPTTELDRLGTRLVYRTDGRAPTKEGESGNNFLQDILVGATQAYEHTNLIDGDRYYYGAFSYDTSTNYSVPAITDEESSDTLPPTWEAGFSPQGTGVSVGTSISVTFTDSMNTASVQSAFKVSPALIVPIFNWDSGNKTITLSHGNMDTSTWYKVTVESTAQDDAGNPMASTLSWSFRTAAGIPPQVSDVKIDGWKTQPGDVISPHPKISGTIYDLDSTARGITTIEILAISLAGTVSHKYSSPELSSIFTIDPIDDHYGSVDVRFPGKLPHGTYTVVLRAYDSTENTSEEAVAGLMVKSGTIDGPVVNYPSEFSSGQGTTIAYNLTDDYEITLIVRNLKGSISYKVSFPPGAPGGRGGYNEVYWDGLSNFGTPLGTGIYKVYVFSGEELLQTFKIIVKN